MEKERKRLQGVLNDLLTRNAQFGGNKYAFIHMGEVFCIMSRKYLRNEKIESIDESLREEAEELRLLRLKLEQDTRRIRQSLAVIIPRCRDKQSLRDALPESIVMLIPAFNGMERIHEEGFLLAEHPHLKKQYEESVELALYYQANELIY